MPKTENRLYKKKSGAFRDARRFFIIAEGEREDRYFSWFQGKNPKRLVIEIIERQGFGSAPQNMLKRLEHFLPESARLEGDQIWFVLDVDRWPREAIEELNQFVQLHQDWNIAVSNPSFEVWLYYHIGDPKQSNCRSSADFKRILPEISTGGYNVEKFAPLIEKAAKNARNADDSLAHHYPEFAISKVYRLADAMLVFLKLPFEGKVR